jgi:hypothetical protein
MIMLAAPAARPIFSTPFHPAQEQKAAPEKDPKSVSLTGCVDERDGSYVLTDDKELAPIANLAADGFPQEGFAKHLGHKITVRGISTPGDPRPTFKVRSITAVSDTCAPQQQ